MRLKPANSLNQVKARHSRVKLRRLLTGTRVEKTFKSTDSAEGADVADMNLTFLYNDGEFWHFMNNTTFEQLSADEKAVGDSAKWLLDQAECIVTLWNGQPISVTPPNFVELEIVETDPGLKGDTAGTGGKPANCLPAQWLKFHCSYRLAK
jgi:elongation factor P